jgi:hypothetical protein
MWSLTSPPADRISGPEKFCSSARKDFFNSIGQEQTLACAISTVIWPAAAAGAVHLVKCYLRCPQSSFGCQSTTEGNIAAISANISSLSVARYLAAHSPTERASLQTADIARRLMRGGELHQEAGSS